MKKNNLSEFQDWIVENYLEDNAKPASVVEYGTGEILDTLDKSEVYTRDGDLYYEVNTMKGTMHYDSEHGMYDTETEVTDTEEFILMKKKDIARYAVELARFIDEDDLNDEICAGIKESEMYLESLTDKN